MTQHSVRVDDLNEIDRAGPVAPKYGRTVVGFKEADMTNLGVAINGWLAGHPGAQIVHLSHANSSAMSANGDLFRAYTALVEFLYLVEEG